MPTRAPTPEELDAIQISDSDVRELQGEVLRVQRALDQAGIPRSADWLIDLLSLSAQMLVPQDMTIELFCGFVETAHHTVGTKEPANFEQLSKELDAVRSSWQNSLLVRASRILSACRSGGVDPDHPDTPVYLLTVAAQGMADLGIDCELAVELAAFAFQEFQRHLKQSKRNGPGAS